MKKVLLFLSILLFSAKMYSSHLTGAEITYTSLGNNQYEVHMTLYWDCTTGFNPGTSQSLNVDGCLGSQFITLNQSAATPGDGVDISQICSSATSTCANPPGSVNGNNMIDYVGIVTLPGGCTDWTFSWSTCCRGGNIINLSGGTSAGNYAYAQLNNVAAPNNNSPIFTAQPLPYLCVNQPACYNFGVVEQDGNTLQYSLVAAQDAANSPLVYNSPYSGTSPLSGITIDPNTGQINFTPTLQGAYIVVVQVQEFDANGVVVGTVIRDVQVVVQNCNNQTIGCGSGGLSTANVTGNGAVLNPANPHEIQICEGIPFSFNVTFTDPNAGDSLKIKTNLANVPALNGAVVTTSYPIPSQPNNVSMNFSWTAPPGSANLNTFLTVTVYDNACPIPGQQVVNYFLNILPAANAGPDTTICLGDNTVLHGSGPGGPYNWYDLSGTMMPTGPQFSCNPCQTPTVAPTTTSTYVIQTGGGAGCVNKDTVTITVVPTFVWALTPGPTASGCTGNPIQLGVTPNPVGVYTYAWSPATDLSQTIVNNPLTTFTLPGTQTYSVTMTSAAGCIKHDSIVVTAQQGPPPFSVRNDTCMNTSTPLPLDVTFNCLSSVSCALSNACPGGASQNFVVGTGSAPDNTSFDWPTPYGNFYRNARHQFLVQASELLALGVQPGNINSIAFNVTALNGIGPLPNFTIKMMCTSLTALPAAIGSDNFVPGTIQVFSATTLNVVLGQNLHTFTQPYAWDGTSNLIIETCFDQTNPSYTDNASVTQSFTSFTSSINAYSDGDPVCTSPISVASFVSFNDYQQRPDMTFNVVSSVNPANYTYQWAPPIGLSNPNIKNPTVTPPNGSTTYTVTVTTLNGLCSRTDSVQISVGGTGADVVTLDSIFCSSDPVQQFFLSPTTPTGGSWVHHVSGTGNGGGVVPTGNTADFHPELSVLGTSYVVYTVGPANCAIKDSVQVLVSQQIPANFTAIGPFCEYDSPTVLSTIANNAGGTWTIDGIAATQFNPATLGPSTPPGYKLKYKTDLGVGCPDSLQKFVEVFAAPTVDFSADTLSGCLPSVPVVFTSTVSATPASSNAYNWSFGDASTSGLNNPVHIYTQTGALTVAVTFTDNHGCVDTETKTQYITINGVPDPDFTYEPSNPTALEPHVDFFNTTPNSGGLLWNWNVANLDSATYFNVSYDFPNYGEYLVTLTATTVNGCEANVTHPVVIRPDYAIYVPSSFSPNGDGKNDIFIPKTDGVQVADYTFSIYDRWGERVFQTNDLSEGWKGSRANTENISNESATYIWKIIYKDAFLKGHTITGHVTIVR